MNTPSPFKDSERQDIGYLLTAYADGQLAPEGVMWVEEQLDRNADLRAKLKEIRQLQAGLRTAFAGGAPAFVLDLPRRDVLLASAANPPRKRINFMPALRIVLAASLVILVVGSLSVPNLLETRSSRYRDGELAKLNEDEFSPVQVTTSDPQMAPTPRGVYDAQLPALRAAPNPSSAFGAEAQLQQAQTASPGDVQERDQLVAYQSAAKDGELREREATRGLNADADRPDVGGVEGGRGRAAQEKAAAVPAAQRYAAMPDNKPVGGTAYAVPAEQSKLMAKREQDAATRQAGDERKKANAAPAVPMSPPAAVASAPPPAVTPAPTTLVAKAKTDRLVREAAKEVDGEKAAATAPKAEPAAPPSDGYVRLNETLAYNGAVMRKDQAPAAKNAAPAKPGAAGPQAGKDKSIEQVPAEVELRDAAPAPLTQFDVAVVEEKQSADDERDLAKGREEAVASSETGSTGAFMAIGAGGGSAGMFGNRTGGAKRRALAGHGPDDFPVLKQVGGVAGLVGDGKPAQVEVAVTDPTVALGTTVRITRNDFDVVDGKVVSLAEGRAVVEVNGQTWNEHGAKIKAGDVVSTIHPPGTIVQSSPSQSQMNDQALALRRQMDPLQSLAALRAPSTLEGTLDLAQALQLIGGEKIGYALTTGAQGFIGRQVKVSLRDEAAARGVLRAVRSAGLQAQFTGGVVHLDTATRPLDPADTQGFDLPTFKDLFGTSPMQITAVDAIQTVAIDADTASYEYVKARVAAGQPVDPATIKPEHFINAMPMDYPAAQGPEAFTLYAEAAPSPFARAGTSWGPRTAVVSIGAVAKPAAADERKPLALTLAIDCSGSMAQAGGLDRIQRGLLAFVEHLRAEDRVSIVAFGDQARVILPATPGNDRAALINALVNLATGGATNAAEGLGLAYQLAAETAAVGVESRVLLATDGGTVAGVDDLLRRVTAFKDRGITLVVVGTGQTYRAGPLQDLATKGDGQHFYVGSDDDAQALFTGKLLPDRLAVLAKDAKLQVTWNPQRVSHARLIGYDQRRLAAKDFRDNTVDAGELSQDTQVTALFEVLLVDGGAGPLGTAAVRYKDMRREQVRELACPLPGTILQSQPSDRLRLLACAAATAEWLQRGWWSNVHLITPQEIAAQLARCPQPIANELRAMVK